MYNNYWKWLVIIVRESLGDMFHVYIVISYFLYDIVIFGSFLCSHHSRQQQLFNTPLVAIHLFFLLNLLRHLQHYQLHQNYVEYWKGTIQYVASSRKNSHVLHNILQNKKLFLHSPIKILYQRPFIFRSLRLWTSLLAFNSLYLLK